MHVVWVGLAHEKWLQGKIFILYPSSGGSGPGPTRALALASKLAVNFIHGKINKHFASSARINKDCHSDKDSEGVRKDE